MTSLKRDVRDRKPTARGRRGMIRIPLFAAILFAAVFLGSCAVQQSQTPLPTVSQDRTESEFAHPGSPTGTESVSSAHPDTTPLMTTGKAPDETPPVTTAKRPDTTPPETTGKQPDETSSATTGREPDGTAPTTTGKQPDGTAPATTGKQPDETAPTTTEKQPGTTVPATTNVPTGSEPLPDSPERAAQTLLDGMSLAEKIYQLFIVAPEQLLSGGGTLTQANADVRAAIGRHPVGGLIFFAGNIKTPSQITGMIADLQAASRTGLFMAVDEEGGRVARLGNNPQMGTAAFPPMGEIGASGDPEKARNVGLTIGRDLKRFGFNLDFAPVADVDSNPDNPVIKDRAFGSDPQLTAKMVAACVQGFRASGVLCTLKHFPGHGDTATDSHYGAASSGKTLEELRACEFLPFEAGIAAGADVVMLGHISLPNVTGNDLPATLSYEITTGILRDQLGFDGLIVTDSMSMAAITKHFSSEEAAVKAILAGADLILMPENLDEAVNGVLNAVKSGEISEERINESVYRILYTKLAQGIISVSSVEQ